MSPQKAFSTPRRRTSGVEEVRTRVSLARALVSVTCLEAHPQEGLIHHKGTGPNPQPVGDTESGTIVC